MISVELGLVIASIHISSHIILACFSLSCCVYPFVASVHRRRQVIPVAPPPVRPSVVMDSSNSCQDDITHQLGTIVQVCGGRAKNIRVILYHEF